MKNSVKVWTLGVGLAAGLAGCKAKPVSDEALATTVQGALAADSALAGQQVAVTVQNGIATLNGAVANDAQRTIAARDAAGVSGVKEVSNGLVVGAAAATAMTAAPAVAAPPVAEPTEPLAPAKPAAGKSYATSAEQRRADEARERQERQERQRQNLPAPIERSAAPQQAVNAPPPPPSAPPPPTYKTVTIQSGDAIPVRMTQTLDSETTQEGTTFSGVVASDILVDGVVAVPAGTPVSGSVDSVHEAGHFKGNSLLTVSLSSLSRKGDRVALTTEPYSVQGKGRGKNTLEKSGIGAAGGAILGGIFGGGKGAAIGAGLGGAGGAGVNAVTRGEQVQIPTETIVRFRLSGPVSVRVRTDGGGRENNDPNLQRR